MDECNSHKTSNIYPNLSVPLCGQQQFRLNKVSEIKDYFVAEIKLMSKRLSINILFLLTILISR